MVLRLHQKIQTRLQGHQNPISVRPNRDASNGSEWVWKQSLFSLFKQPLSEWRHLHCGNRSLPMFVSYRIWGIDLWYFWHGSLYSQSLSVRWNLFHFHFEKAGRFCLQLSPGEERKKMPLTRLVSYSKPTAAHNHI